MTNKIIFSYETPHSKFQSHSIYLVIHELMGNRNQHQNHKIDVVVECENKKHPIIIDSLLSTDFALISTKRNYTYNFDQQSMKNLIDYYDSLTQNQINRLIENVIMESMTTKPNVPVVSSPITPTPLVHVQTVNPDMQVQQPPIVKSITSDVADTLKNVTKLLNDAHTLPTIEKVILEHPQSESSKYSSNVCSSDDESNESSSEESYDSSKSDANQTNNVFPNFNIKKVRKQNVKLIDSDEEKNDIANEIKKLEAIKEKMNLATEKLQEDLNDEKQNLSNYQCTIMDQEFQLKKEQERLYREFSIYASERDFTYKKIFNGFFVKRKITWETLPPLFLAKFPVYLFLDGKNLEGEQIRDNLLETEDGFRLFRLLYDALTDDEFELPDDGGDCALIEQFMNNLPPIQIVTEEDIMSALENKDDNMFNCDETSQQSADDDPDDKINTFGGPSMRKAE